MKRFLLIIGLLLASCFTAFSQVADVQVSTVADYNGWGWEAIVIGNGIITTATVPVIGGRVMQYDLGEHSSIYVNKNEFGKTYEPKNDSFWPNFGGFKNWPAPQAVWNWPPPPVLDHGEYVAVIKTQTADSVVLTLASPVEKWDSPGIRINREMTIYKGSSRVKMAQTLINDNTTIKSWSMWDITQSIVNHPGKKDYQNFWIYFPIKENSLFGDDGVRWDKSSASWTGEAAPGIYGVKSGPDGKKLFADSPEGWISYVDTQDGYAYSKTFPVWEDGEYPDEGARVAVYIASDYCEVEVTSPIVDLDANGGTYTFTEDWWAAQVNGPILAVNNAGAVAFKITRENNTHAFIGEYGIFYVGTAKLTFLDAEGTVLGEGQPHEVTPMATFFLEESMAVPAGSKSVEVRVYDYTGALVGAVDTANIDDLTGVKTESKTPVGFVLKQNYPNPFNPQTTIEFAVPADGFVRLNVYDVTGKQVAEILNQPMAAGEHRTVFDASTLSNGVYFYRLQEAGVNETRKMLLIK